MNIINVQEPVTLRKCESFFVDIDKTPLPVMEYVPDEKRLDGRRYDWAPFHAWAKDAINECIADALRGGLDAKDIFVHVELCVDPDELTDGQKAIGYRGLVHIGPHSTGNTAGKVRAEFMYWTSFDQYEHCLELDIEQA